MTKLSDTQAIILSAAAQRDGHLALPLPTSLRGGAAKKVVGALLAKGYLAEIPAGRAPGTLVWEETGDGFTTLVATAEGLGAIGIEPEGGDDAGGDPAAGTQTDDSCESVTEPDSAPEGRTEPEDTGEAPEGGSGTESATTADTGAERGTAPKVRAGTKQAALIAMLRAPGGTTIAEIAAATGWQPHTVRGAIAGALKKRLGLTVTSERVEGRGRAYRLPAP